MSVDKHDIIEKYNVYTFEFQQYIIREDTVTYNKIIKSYGWLILHLYSNQGRSILQFA